MIRDSVGLIDGDVTLPRHNYRHDIHAQERTGRRSINFDRRERAIFNHVELEISVVIAHFLSGAGADKDGFRRKLLWHGAYRLRYQYRP